MNEITALRNWLERIDYNMSLYLDGRIKWSEIEYEYTEYRKENFNHDLETLYFLSEDNFLRNLLINKFDNCGMQIINFTDEYLKDTFLIKLKYLLLNNINLCQSELKDIIKNYHAYFTNTERHFLGIKQNQYFGEVLGFDNIFNKEVERFKKLQSEILKKFDNYL